MSSISSLFDLDYISQPQSPILLRDDPFPIDISEVNSNLALEEEEPPIAIDGAGSRQQQQNPAANTSSAQPVEESGIIDITKDDGSSDGSEDDIEILPGAVVNHPPVRRASIRRMPIVAHYEPYSGKSKFNCITSRTIETHSPVESMCCILII